MQALFDSTSFFGQEVGGTTQVPLIVGAWPVGQQVPVFESCATGQATGHAQPPPACAVAPAGQVDGVVVAAVGLHVLSDCGAVPDGQHVLAPVSWPLGQHAPPAVGDSPAGQHVPDVMICEVAHPAGLSVV